MSGSHRLNGSERRRVWIRILAVAVPPLVVLVVVSAAFGLGASGLQRTAIPACEDLPSMSEVIHALEQRAEFVGQLLAIGPDVRVQPEDPCGDGTLRGVVTVRYRTAQQREAINELFGRSDALGVPAQVIR